MKKVDGSITTTEEDGSTREQFLFTYSEEQKQQHKINEENAKLVFSPEFIPFYPAIKKEFSLTNTEAHLYGFILFYMSNGSKRFYFTNDQLASVLDCSEGRAKKSLSKLKQLHLIEVSYKVKSGGGTIRFVTNVHIPRPVQNVPVRGVQNEPVRPVQNVPPNKNKIKENKINTEKGEENVKSLESKTQQSIHVKNLDILQETRELTLEEKFVLAWNQFFEGVLPKENVVGVEAQKNIRYLYEHFGKEEIGRKMERLREKRIELDEKGMTNAFIRDMNLPKFVKENVFQSI